MAAVLDQAFERLEQGQIRFGAGKTLRAAARAIVDARPGRVGEEFFDQRRLPYARLSRDAHERTPAGSRVAERRAKLATLALASDGVPLRPCSPIGARRDLSRRDSVRILLGNLQSRLTEPFDQVLDQFSVEVLPSSSHATAAKPGLSASNACRALRAAS